MALVVKDASNRQGEGVAYAFTIDRSDQGKPLQIEFNSPNACNIFDEN